MPTAFDPRDNAVMINCRFRLAAMCLWLASVTALAGAQDREPPTVADLRSRAEQGDLEAQFSLAVMLAQTYSFTGSYAPTVTVEARRIRNRTDVGVG